MGGREQTVRSQRGKTLEQCQVLSQGDGFTGVSHELHIFCFSLVVLLMFWTGGSWGRGQR